MVSRAHYSTIGYWKNAKKEANRKTDLPLQNLMSDKTYFMKALRMYLTTSQICLSFKVLP